MKNIINNLSKYNPDLSTIFDKDINQLENKKVNDWFEDCKRVHDQIIKDKIKFEELIKTASDIIRNKRYG